MRTMTALLLCLASPAAIVSAQTPAPVASAAAQLTQGAKIFDTSGGEVGTIDAIAGDVVTVSTGTNKVAIPKGSFGAGANGAVLAMTKAQLDAAAGDAAGKAAAATKTAMTPGAEVRGSAGQNVVGTIKSVEGEFALVTTPKGDVRLPATLFATGPSGLVIGMTATDFDKAVTDATAAAPAPAAPSAQ